MLLMRLQVRFPLTGQAAKELEKLHISHGLNLAIGSKLCLIIIALLTWGLDGMRWHGQNMHSNQTIAATFRISFMESEFSAD
jgi:hypothetical protein